MLTCADKWLSGPLSRYSGGGLGWGRHLYSRPSKRITPPPLPSPGVPGEGEMQRRAHVSRSHHFKSNVTDTCTP
jgi:hypothetical protein